MKCTNTYSPPSGSNFFIGKGVELKNDDSRTLLIRQFHIRSET